jgi:hypothetical protein
MVDKENGGLKRRLDKVIPTGIIFTMNCPEELANKINYNIILDENVKTYRHIMGYAEGLYSYDTTQFPDFSKYNCDLFDPEIKAKVHEEQFPIDKNNAFELGKKLAQM